MKKIQLEGGLTVRTFVPPPEGFDPFTASSMDLERAGFPPLPADPHHLERYKRVFSHIKHKLIYVEPTFRVNHDRFHGPRKRQPTEGPETSPNWSGGVVYAPAGQSFKWVGGDWVVPDVNAPTQGQWYYCASWIGIDGDGSDDVFQAGVSCDVCRNVSQIMLNIYPWWEWWPGPEVQITNTTFGVSTGDMISMLVCSASGAGSTTGTIFMSNRITGVWTFFQVTAPGTTKLVGNSAEWIVEAPEWAQVGRTQSAMADYGQVFFDECFAVTLTGTTVNAGTGNNVNRTYNGNVDSRGVLVAPNVVQCLYEGASPA